MAVKQLAVLGSTGSIGVTTLDLVARFPQRFAATALAAGRNIERLAEQVRRFRPRLVATADGDTAAALRSAVPDFNGEIVAGIEGIERVATAPDAELVISALVGALGLGPTLRAIEAGKDVALANKEVLVVAGELVQAAARRARVNVFPLDSEHNAIYQAMHGHRRGDVKRIILTASGGPFLRTPREELRSATPAQALKHPTWQMGSKITIDSSTLMNKGLEVIEAHWLFDLPPEQIDVVIHPQSIVHSMVEYVDGSVLAQLGIPDMSIPISYILAYPERLTLTHLPSLDLVAAGRLEFLAPDLERFPCLGLAYRVLRTKGSAPAVLNAANEVLVDAFLKGRIGYLDIPRIAGAVLDRHDLVAQASLEQLLAADAWARRAAEELSEQTRSPSHAAAQAVPGSAG
jgi:1-deoxy-D-xylulose-5-phosphate reductoisomerase